MKPEKVETVYVVIGSLPWEFTRPLSGWVTEDAAKAEAERLEKLSVTVLEDEAEQDARFEELQGATDFWVDPLDIYHQEASK